MRTAWLAAILAPVLAEATVLPHEHSTGASHHHVNGDISSFPSLGPGSGSNGSPIEFKVPLPAKDDALLFSFEVHHPSQEEVICGRPNVAVNGFTLVHNQHDDLDEENQFGTPDQNLITAIRDSDNLVSSLQVWSKSECLWDRSLPELNNPFEVHSVRVHSIDGKILHSPVGFSAILNQRNRSILAILGSDSVAPLPGTQVKLNVPSIFTVNQEDTDALRQSVEEELSKLQRLLELFEVQHIYSNSTSHSVDLDEPDEEIKSCDTVKCVFRVIYHKAKKCLVDLHDKLAIHSASHLRGYRQRCRTPSDTQESGWFMAHFQQHHCSPSHYTGPHDQQAYQQLPSENFEDDASSEKSYSSSFSSSHGAFSSSHESSGASQTIHIAVAIAGSLLCLICFKAILHQRCCSPRARADRAARREERRTAREYRRLARRQAWRNCWGKVGGRFTRYWRPIGPRNGDYEEKRSLIVSQEAVLEQAMQNHIQQLQRDAGTQDPVSAAEQGMLSRQTSLPGYRSRSDSGRPPSYTSIDPHPDATPDVLDGFSNYTPSDAMVRDDRSDTTPDSSVAAVSPRISSETLRTERSMT